MRRSLALLIPALVLAAACTQSPTAATRQPSVRFDGGNYFGSGNLVASGTENATGSTASDGGNTLGSGSAGGFDTGNGAAASLADSATSGERGTNYHGSGN